MCPFSEIRQLVPIQRWHKSYKSKRIFGLEFIGNELRVIFHIFIDKMCPNGNKFCLDKFPFPITSSQKWSKGQLINVVIMNLYRATRMAWFGSFHIQTDRWLIIILWGVAPVINDHNWINIFCLLILLCFLSIRDFPFALMILLACHQKRSRDFLSN